MQNLTVDHVLNQIRSRHDLKSDYAIGKTLNISLPVISGWRNGKSLPDERMCAKLAEAAGIDPLVLTASMQAQRSKTAEARSAWQQIAERLQLGAQGAVAALAAVTVAIGFIASPAEDASATTLIASQHSTSAQAIHRI